MEEKNHIKKILVVEDEETLQKAFLAALTGEEGVKLFQAFNGVEGLEIALAEHPDLILLDIIMPKLGGVKMLEELRKDKWGKEVPVIILTNLNVKEKIAEAAQSNVYDYFIKSDWDISEIVDKVKEKLFK